MSVEMTAGCWWRICSKHEVRIRPTTVVRKDSLASIGGYTALKDYIAYDFCRRQPDGKGRLPRRSLRPRHQSCVNQKSFRRMWQNQLRWRKHALFASQGHFGSGLIFSMLTACLDSSLAALVTGLGNSPAGCGGAEPPGRSVARGLDGGSRSAKYGGPLLYPLRDLLGFAVWFASYLNLRYVWRDSRFELKGNANRIAATYRIAGSFLQPANLSSFHVRFYCAS